MKSSLKILSIILSLLLCFIVSGCTKSTDSDEKNADSSSTSNYEESVPAVNNNSSKENLEENALLPRNDKSTKTDDDKSKDINKSTDDNKDNDTKNKNTTDEEKQNNENDEPKENPEPSNPPDNEDNNNNNNNNNNDVVGENNNESGDNSSEGSTKIDASALDNTKTAWWFKPNNTHTTPEINTALKYNLSDYDAHYVGDTSRKVLYLTFDEGYENGYTEKILDILKENDVKAIFFVTSPYIKSNPDLIKRMVNEGHIVGNHTNHHPSMPDVTGDTAKFENEFTDVADKFKEITGQDIPLYFRPPMGEYSQKSLAMTKNLGYKTVFWSFAYHDWDINDQPDPAKAKEKILGGLHNGSILLIHAVSKTNTEILDSVIKEAKAQGYVFELLP